MPPKRGASASNGAETKNKRKKMNDGSSDMDEEEEMVKPNVKGKKSLRGGKAAEAAYLNDLNFDVDAQTPDGDKWNMKIVSWNVNGIRAWLQKGGAAYVKLEKPDIFCLMETKCSQDKLPDEASIEGYTNYWLSGDAEGYSGVGLYTKIKPIDVSYGIGMDDHDREGRIITAEYEKFYVVVAYVPNSGRKLVRLDYRKQWDIDFRAYLKDLDEKKPVILSGDLNVAHEEIDLAKPKNNKRNAGFTQEERDGFTELLSSNNFVDSFRHLHPDEKDAYTFWTYMMNSRAKNVGWRLDYFVLSKSLLPNLCENIIRKDVIGSDHCPIALFLHV